MQPLYPGSKWHTRRKLLTGTFHLKTLEMYNISFNKHSRILAKNLIEACADNKEIPISEYIALCSLDMICGNYKNVLHHKINVPRTDDFTIHKKSYRLDCFLS